MGRCAKRCTPPCALFTLSVIAIITGLLMLFIGVAVPNLINEEIRDTVDKSIINDERHNTNWKNFADNLKHGDPPYYMNFWVFNVTNPHEVMYLGHKAKVQVLGPYSYREWWKKYDVSYHDNHKYNKYKLWEYYTFDEDESAPHVHPSDPIYSVNIPLQGVLGQLAGGNGDDSSWYGAMGVAILAALSKVKSEMIVKLTAEQVIFGYTDPLLLFLNQTISSIPAVAGSIPAIDPVYTGIQVNTTFEVNKATTGYTVMFTGRSDVDKVNQYYSYNGQTVLDVWDSDEANRIRGTDAYQYRPRVHKSESLWTFVDNISRSSHLKYNKTVHLHGIKLYRYQIPTYDMKTASEYPPNAAYFQFCPSGAMNLTSQSQNAPIFVSKPYFFEGDPIYRTMVDDLPEPNNYDHQTVIDVEPQTGVVFRAYKRLQINLHLKNFFFLYPNVTEAYLPVAYAEETSQLTPDQASTFKDEIYGIEHIVHWDELIAPIIGICLVCAGLLFYNFALAIFKERKRDKFSGIQMEDDEKDSLLSDT